MKLNDLNPILRDKVVGAFCDQGRQIGDVTYSDEEKAQLKEFYLSLQNRNNWTMEEFELATAFLVCVTKNYKGDWVGKEFWGKIEPQIGWKPDYTDKLPKIGETLTRYNRPLFITKSNIHKYVESLFYQAYSPQSSVKSFIKLIWSLYTNPDVFDFTFLDSESDGRLCEAIIESLNKHYKDLDFDSDFVFESTTYSIRAGLRYAFEQDKRGATLLIRRILKYIDYIYNHREKVDENEGYLGQLCNDCVPRLIASYSENVSTIRRIRPRETVDDIDKVKASYVFHGGLLNLYFPKIRLFRENQQFKKATVNLYICVDNQIIEIGKENFDCVGEDYKHVLREIYIPLDKYLDFFGEDINLLATLSFDDNEPVYNSKQQLFRNFIVFKDETECKSTLLNPGDYRIIHPLNFSCKENLHSKESPIIKTEYNFDIYLYEGDRISFNGSYVFFGKKETGSHFFFDEESTQEVRGMTIKGTSSCPYTIYKSIGNFIIRTDDVVKPDYLDVQIFSDSGENLYNFPLSRHESNNGVFSISLEKYILETRESNIFPLILVIKDLNRDKFLFNKHFVVLPDLTVFYGRTPYENNTSSETVVSFLGETYRVNNALQLYSQEVDTKAGLLDIEIPYFSWKINEESYRWSSVPRTLPFLLEEFQANDLLFIDSFYDNVKVYCGDNEILESDKKGVFLLGKFIASPEGHQAFINSADFYAVIERDKDKFLLPLFSTTSEPYLLDADADSFINFENGILNINLTNNFRGNVNSRFKITLCGLSSKGLNDEIEGKLTDNFTFAHVSSDIYELTISYKNPYSHGDYWDNIWSDELELGDLNQIRFDNIRRININKISHCKIKDLYLIGEVLDIDGICGGYNLTIAWLSGILSGSDINA